MRRQSVALLRCHTLSKRNTYGTIPHNLNDRPDRLKWLELLLLFDNQGE
jgi:hypothetical protein